MKRNAVLRFIVNHKSLNKFFMHFRWYNNLLEKKALEIIKVECEGDEWK